MRYRPSFRDFILRRIGNPTGSWDALHRMVAFCPFHVKMAKKAGASRDEVISAILVGLPAAGHIVTEVLPVAIDSYDDEQ